MKELRQAFKAIAKHNREVTGLKPLYCFTRDSWLRMSQNITVCHARVYTSAKSFSWLGWPGNKHTTALGRKVDIGFNQIHPVDGFSVNLVQTAYTYRSITFYVYGTTVTASEFLIYTLEITKDGWYINRHVIPLMVGEPAEGTLEYSWHWN